VPVAFVTALLFAFVDCGGRTDDGSGANAAVDRGGACVASPPAGDPKAPDPTSFGPRFYAIRKLYIGDADRSGNPSPTAWRGFGFDIDGRSTPDTLAPDAATGLCALIAGASPRTHDDGDCGTDNSFGANLLPVFITTLGADLPAISNAAIANGGATDILVVSDIGSGRDARSVSGELVQAPPLGHVPAWDGTDRWPVDRASLSGPGYEEGRLQLTGYARDGVFVGTALKGGGAITVLTYRGNPLRLPVTRLVISARISDDGRQLLDGTISGVMDTEAVIAAIHTFARAEVRTCFEECWDCVAQQIRQTSDILRDGTQDSARTCDGISIGLGFEASAIEIGPVVTVPPLPDSCAFDASFE
jgi:hypothetical protein